MNKIDNNKLYILISTDTLAIYKSLEIKDDNSHLNKNDYETLIEGEDKSMILLSSSNDDVIFDIIDTCYKIRERNIPGELKICHQNNQVSKITFK